MSADKRTPATDALETLGMIHFKEEKRDAIHLAVEAVEAVVDLNVGQRIGIVDGKAYPAGAETHRVLADGTAYRAPVHGIVDPFLPRGPKVGDKFWFVMMPRMVQSLRHVWDHQDFPIGE